MGRLGAHVIEPSIVKSGRRPINSCHLRHISSWRAKTIYRSFNQSLPCWEQWTTYWTKTSNDNCLSPRSFKRSYGQMMLCPEGRRHWSRWGYFHQLAPGGLKPSSRIGSPAKMEGPKLGIQKGHYICYIYIYVYSIVRKDAKSVCIHRYIMYIYKLFICPSFFLKYLISTMCHGWWTWRGTNPIMICTILNADDERRGSITDAPPLEITETEWTLQT